MSQAVYGNSENVITGKAGMKIMPLSSSYHLDVFTPKPTNNNIHIEVT